jgi:tetratricopeptide (TPR) repeat protein
MAVFDYGEAIRLLERTIDVQEVLDPEESEKRCDLLLDFGRALIMMPDLQRVYDSTAPEALKLAQGLHDDDRCAKACCQALDALHRARSPSVFVEPIWSQWAEATDRYAGEDTSERVRANMAMGLGGLRRSQLEGWQLRMKALTLARRLGNRQDLFLAASSSLFTDASPELWAERLALAREFAAEPRDGVNGRTLASVLWWCGAIILSAGDRTTAEGAWRDVEAVTASHEDPAGKLFPLFSRMTLAVLDGRLQEAIETLDVTLALGQELGIGTFATSFSEGIVLGVWNYLGQYEEGVARMTIPRAGRIWCLVGAGRHDEARELLKAFPPINSVQVWSFRLQIAGGLSDLPAAGEALDRLATVPECVMGAWDNLSIVARNKAEVLVQAGEVAAAHRELETAISQASTLRFRPELALSRLGLAELLLEHYPDERDAAIEHLDFAIAEFQDMKMQPALERALRHRGLLKA